MQGHMSMAGKLRHDAKQMIMMLKNRDPVELL